MTTSRPPLTRAERRLTGSDDAQRRPGTDPANPAELDATDPSQRPTLSVVDLVKTYGQRRAVDGVSFAIAPGECYGLLGPNGAGKTTTILAVCGLLAPDRGTVRVGGENPHGSRRPAVEARRRVGYVPQDIALYDDLSGRENLHYFARLYGLRRRGRDERVAEVLRFVDLEGRAADKVAVYSGGMKRRLNLAAALLHEPELLVLDEPTVGIDPQSRNAILANLDALREQGTALLYTSHYMEEIERICDRVGIMDDGRLLAEGTVESLVGSAGEDAGRLVLTTGRPPTDEQLAGLTAVAGVGSVTATADGPVLSVVGVADTLPAVLSCCGRLGLRINRISVDQADLEDVFLHLTGKALRDG